MWHARLPQYARTIAGDARESRSANHQSLDTTGAPPQCRIHPYLRTRPTRPSARSSSSRTTRKSPSVLRLELEHEGFEVEVCGDGASAIERALKGPDLIILDLLLPRIDGLEVCRRVRAKRPCRSSCSPPKTRCPIASPDSTPAPTTTCPSRSRSKSCWRASAPGCANANPPSTCSSIKDLKLDRDTPRSVAQRTRHQLTAKEYALLEFLLMYRNKVHTRDELFNSVWGSISWASRT